MTKFDINRASPETRDELLRAFIAHEANTCTEADVDRFMAARKKWMAECEVELRTRAERDANIVRDVLYYFNPGYTPHVNLYDKLEKLCAEPVTDDGPEQAELTEARAKIAELERARDSLIDTGATLRADNERFAQELLDARNKVAELEEFHLRVCDMLDYVNRADGQGGYECAPNKLIFDEIHRLKDVPCERRHLTEAEEALCHYVDTRVVPWDTHTYGGFADYLNAVRDERRQQTTGAHVASKPRAEEARTSGPPTDDPESTFEPSALAGAPVEPDLEPERCSCEEAEKLKRIVEIERRTSRELAQKIRNAIEVLS